MRFVFPPASDLIPTITRGQTQYPLTTSRGVGFYFVYLITPRMPA